MRQVQKRLNILKIIFFINNLCKKNTKISFNYIAFRSPQIRRDLFY